MDRDGIAALTTGFTGADIANLVNEAAIIATRRNAVAVTFKDFLDAIERIVAGVEKKSRTLSKAERRRVAYHEMGHAPAHGRLRPPLVVHRANQRQFARCSNRAVSSER